MRLIILVLGLSSLTAADVAAQSRSGHVPPSPVGCYVAEVGEWTASVPPGAPELPGPYPVLADGTSLVLGADSVRVMPSTHRWGSLTIGGADDVDPRRTPGWRMPGDTLFMRTGDSFMGLWMKLTWDDAWRGSVETYSDEVPSPTWRAPLELVLSPCGRIGRLASAGTLHPL